MTEKIIKSNNRITYLITFTNGTEQYVTCEMSETYGVVTNDIIDAIKNFNFQNATIFRIGDTFINFNHIISIKKIRED